MTIFILGLAHGVQTADGGCSAAQKSGYREFLSQLIRERSAEFIGEEVSPGRATIAGELAMSLGIPWEPIDMSESEKEKLGVPKKWGTEPTCLGADACTQLTEEGYQRNLGNGWVDIERRHPTDKVRDDFMFDRVICGVGSVNSVLVLCGYNHLIQLKRKFREAGHDVDSDVLYKYKWFGS
ncbi:MAG: hypothetical protein ABSD63_17100 [Candidatus Korobacteraceae bacterium]